MADGLTYWRCIDPMGLVKQDEVAERCLAGCAIADARQAALGKYRLDASLFYDQRYWHVIQAASELPVGLVDNEAHWTEAARLNDYAGVSQGCEARVQALMSQGYQRSWLVSLVSTRPVVADSSGWYVRRLIQAREARAEVTRHLEALEALGVDVKGLVEGHQRYLDLCAWLNEVEALGVQVVWPEGQGFAVPEHKEGRNAA